MLAILLKITQNFFCGKESLGVEPLCPKFVRASVTSSPQIRGQNEGGG